MGIGLCPGMVEDDNVVGVGVGVVVVVGIVVGVEDDVEMDACDESEDIVEDDDSITDLC